jgi:hypothetical protein
MMKKAFLFRLTAVAVVLVLAGCFGEGSPIGTDSGSGSGGGGSGGGETETTTKLLGGNYVWTSSSNTYKCSIAPTTGSNNGILTVISVPASSSLYFASVTVFSYSITGTSMKVTRPGYAPAYYTVNSSTKFSGYGETWTRIAN